MKAYILAILLIFSLLIFGCTSRPTAINDVKSIVIIDANGFMHNITLNDLNDVNVDTVVGGDALVFNALSGLWEPGTLTSNDIYAKISATDTTTNYLEQKLAAGSNIIITKINTGANEQLRIDSNSSGTDTNCAVPGSCTYLVYANDDINRLKNYVRYDGNLVIPTQVGQSGKYLKTNGITVSWETISTTDTNWQTSWSVFDLNMKSTYLTDFNHLGGAGMITSPTIVDNNNGSLNISSSTVVLYSGLNWSGSQSKYEVPAINNLFLLDNSVNYIYVDYNAGVPIYAITSNPAVINSSTRILAVNAYREGTRIHYIPVNWGLATETRLVNRSINLSRFDRSSGLMLSESTVSGITRVINISSGVIWYGPTNFVESPAYSFDGTNAGAVFYYHVGGNWVSADVNSYNNNQYDDGNNLVSASNNKYLVNWIYRFVDGDDEPKIGFVLGSDAYSTLIKAAVAPEVSAPIILQRQAILVGRIIVMTDSNTAAQIDSAFTQVFVGSTVTSHNNLADIQGGAPNEYYHLDLNTYNSVLDGFTDTNAWTAGIINDQNVFQIDLNTIGNISLGGKDINYGMNNVNDYDYASLNLYSNNILWQSNPTDMVGITGWNLTADSDWLFKTLYSSYSGDNGFIFAARAISGVADGDITFKPNDTEALILKGLDQTIKLPAYTTDGCLQTSNGDGTVIVGSCGTTTIDTNWETSWDVFDSNMKATYSPLDLNTVVYQNYNLTKDPTGFPFSSGTILTFFDSNRYLFICPSNGTDFFYLYKGNKITVTGCKSVQIADTNGQLNWVYFNDTSGTPKTSNSINFAENAQIATVYWNNFKGLLGYEQHGYSMDYTTHGYLHFTVGARYISGLTGIFNDNNTFSITNGRIYDEDLLHNVANIQVGGKIFYRQPTTLYYTWDNNSTSFYKTSGGVLVYDNSGTLTPVTNGYYVAYWIFAAPDDNQPIYSLVGQRQDSSLTNAQNNQTYENLALGTLPSPEFKLLYRVILRYQGGNTTVENITDYRTVSNLPSGTYTATSHASLTNLNWASSGHYFDTNLNLNGYDLNVNNVYVNGILYGGSPVKLGDDINMRGNDIINANDVNATRLCLGDNCYTSISSGGIDTNTQTVGWTDSNANWFVDLYGADTIYATGGYYDGTYTRVADFSGKPCWTYSGGWYIHWDNINEVWVLEDGLNNGVSLSSYAHSTTLFGLYTADAWQETISPSWGLGKNGDINGINFWGSDVRFNNVYNKVDGTIAIDIANRQARDLSSNVIMEWNNAYSEGAIFPNNIGDAVGHTDSIDPNGRALYDGTGTVYSLDWANRILYDPTGLIPLMTWNNQAGLNAPAFGSVQIAGNVYEQTSTMSIDPTGRILYASDGLSQKLKWGNPTGPIEIYYGGLHIVGNFPDGSLNVDGGANFINGIYDTAGSGLGVLSIDPNNRILYTNDGTTSSLNWVSRYLNGTSGETSVDWANRYLYDTTASFISVDWANRQLIKDGGQSNNVKVLDWLNQYLVANDGTSTRYDWQNNIIYDSSTYQSSDFSNRLLYAPDGSTQLIDWTMNENSSAYLSFDEYNVGSGPTMQVHTSIEMESGYKIYQAGVLTIDQENRILYDSTGSASSVNWESRALYNTAGVDTVDWQNAILDSPSYSNPSINWDTRILYANDGVSPEIDYSGTMNSSTAISFGGQNKLPIFYFGIIDNNPNGQVLSIDPNYRTLYGNDGTATNLLWGSNLQFPNGVYDPSNYLVYDTDARTQYATDGSTPIFDLSGTVNYNALISMWGSNAYIGTQGLYAGNTGNKALDVYYQKLTNGNYDSLDWDTDGLIEIGEDSANLDSTIRLHYGSSTSYKDIKASSNGTELSDVYLLSSMNGNGYSINNLVASETVVGAVTSSHGSSIGISGNTSTTDIPIHLDAGSEWVTLYGSSFKMYSPDGDVLEYDGGNTDQLFFYKQLNLGNGATIQQVDEGSSNYIVYVNGLRDASLSAGTVIADSDGDLSSVTGLTDNSSYWMCTASDCSTTCQVILENGLITGCS